MISSQERDIDQRAVREAGNRPKGPTLMPDEGQRSAQHCSHG
jgi:hypothetical protein